MTHFLLSPVFKGKERIHHFCVLSSPKVNPLYLAAWGPKVNLLYLAACNVCGWTLLVKGTHTDCCLKQNRNIEKINSQH
jgi:hypothetical protein